MHRGLPNSLGSAAPEEAGLSTSQDLQTSDKVTEKMEE